MDPALVYYQSTGEIKDPTGALVTTGWAGKGIGKNNPKLQDEVGIGPLPQGLYRVGEWEPMRPGLGPMVARLVQIEGETFGRSGFYFHGAATDPLHYGQESKGCIVVNHVGRVQVKLHAPEGSLVRVVA